MPSAGFALLSSNGNEAHMTASDTLYAYEAGLITKAEAAEQALVDRLDDLYEQAGASRRSRPSEDASAARPVRRAS